MAENRSKYLQLQAVSGGMTVVFVPSDCLTSGSKSRAYSMLRRVKRIVKKQHWPSEIKDGELRISLPAESSSRDAVISSIEKVLEELAGIPMQPHEVEEALSITSRERVQWTKDRRLPASGVRSFKKGRKLFFATYDPQKVRQLVEKPEIIAAWRREDSKKDVPDDQ